MRSAFLVLLASACVPTAPEAPTPVPEPVSMHDAMREHVTRLHAANRALVDSDVAAARSELAWIAGHPVTTEALAPYAKEHLDGIRAAAEAGAGSDAPLGVARGVGRIAVQCGSCHTRAKIGPKPSGRNPPDGTGIKRTMRRYEWAANAMVDGMITGDAETWVRASHVMLTEPLHDVNKPDGSPAPAEVDAFTRRLSELGLEGLGASEAAGRGELYAEFVATCGACHAVTDGGPGAAAERAKASTGE